GVGKTTLMNAHMPFIPYRDRPISIDEGSREVRLPHETGVSLTTRDHEREHRRVTMADLMTECNYLNPDVEVIAEVNTPASFETFAETLNTGHGLLGTTHASDVETLVNRLFEQDLPPHLLEEIDLLVFPRRADGERYVGSVVELVDERTYRELDRPDERCGVVRRDGTSIHWNEIVWREPDGSFDFVDALRYDGTDPADPDGSDGHRQTNVFRRLGRLTDRTPSEVRSGFGRRHRYVQYLVREGIDDFETLFSVLADLETNEAATVERLRPDTEPTTTPRIEVEDGDD
ncbi:MAG: ATPase, T2SS/T4P/T4SS family, partial [Haloarculaceae archaeon]